MSWSTQRALQVASDTIVKQDSQIQRALQVLQKAQRYELQPLGDYQGEGMVHSSSGDYVEFSDVRSTIDILQEGRQ